jgi:hypothetical protein
VLEKTSVYLSDHGHLTIHAADPDVFWELKLLRNMTWADRQKTHGTFRITHDFVPTCTLQHTPNRLSYLHWAPALVV